jgi:hypothetical protein
MSTPPIESAFATLTDHLTIIGVTCCYSAIPAITARAANQRLDMYWYSFVVQQTKTQITDT